jgi:3-oxoacyl-[acyl-carrier protein] reductase
LNHEKPLSKQVAVVTGAGRGIGEAISHKLAELGATLVLTGRQREPLEATASALSSVGAKADVFPCDVQNLRSVEALASHVVQKHGRTDILINNAGIGVFGKPLHELDPDDWDKILNTNLRGVYYMMRSFAPTMISAKSGHIVNISSLAGKNPVPNSAAYSASKWGLNGLTYSVAEELRGYGVRVSVVCPGSVDTDLSPHSGKEKTKMLTPGDVAHAVGMIVTQAPASFVSEVLIRPTQKP